MDAWQRGRRLAAELSLAALGFFTGNLALVLLVSVGLVPNAKDVPVLGLLYGPLCVVVAAVAYGFVADRLDEDLAQPLEPLPGRVFPVGARATTVVFLAHAVLTFAGSEAISWAQLLAGFPVTEQKTVLSLFAGDDVRPLYVLVFAAVCVAPVAEEWFFRVLLFRRTRWLVGRGLAYALGAAAFAWVHQNPSGALVYAWLAVCFSSVYERTGRVWAPIALHATNNALTLAVLFLMGVSDR